MIDPRPIQEAFRRGDGPGAAKLLEQAAGAGNADAAVELALLYLQGSLVPRDLRGARLWFGRAGELGHRRSLQIRIAFEGVGIGGPRRWADALAAQRELAADDEGTAKDVALLDRMAIDPEGDPLALPPAETVSNHPHVEWRRGLLSREECARLREFGTPYLEPSAIIDPTTGMARPHPIRTSLVAAFPWVDETPFIHALNRRFAAATQTHVEQGEPLQLLSYSPGQQYRAHMDALPPATTPNQRILTLLVYLNEDYEGGETSFAKAGLNLKGRTGDALIFRNTTPDGRPDPASVHAGNPVTSGTKWLASRWIRQEPFGDR